MMHNTPPRVSTSVADFQSMADLQAETGKDPLIIAHGVFMVIGWMVFASVGIITAMFYKPAWPDNATLFGMKPWFAIHRTSTLITLVFCALGFIVIFAYADGYSEIRRSKFSKSHPVIGIIVMILTVVNPIMSIYRCQPGTTHRLIFNWVHRGIGVASYFFSILTIFSASTLATAGLPGYTNTVVWLYVVWIIVVVLVLHAHEVISERKKSAVVTNTMEAIIDNGYKREGNKPVVTVAWRGTFDNGYKRERDTAVVNSAWSESFDNGYKRKCGMAVVTGAGGKSFDNGYMGESNTTLVNNNMDEPIVNEYKREGDTAVDTNNMDEPIGNGYKREGDTAVDNNTVDEPIGNGYKREGDTAVDNNTVDEPIGNGYKREGDTAVVTNNVEDTIDNVRKREDDKAAVTNNVDETIGNGYKREECTGVVTNTVDGTSDTGDKSEDDSRQKYELGEKESIDPPSYAKVWEGYPEVPRYLPAGRTPQLQPSAPKTPVRQTFKLAALALHVLISVTLSLVVCVIVGMGAPDED